ncbi:hypothetical protein HMSSN139_34040 [Paenibacillus sp. HMSSN-139]|nr:hypothetical protein HMSSN139_34040 [Paenibacillus sp. HMSSN-139]
MERKRFENYLKTQRELKFQAAKEQTRQRSVRAATSGKTGRHERAAKANSAGATPATGNRMTL